MIQYIQLVKAEYYRYPSTESNPKILEIVKFLLAVLRKGISLFLSLFYLRNATTGNQVYCNGKPSLQISGILKIGNRTSLWSTIQQTRSSVFKNASMIIGNHTFINGARIAAKHHIEIGDHVHIAPEVIIMESDFHDTSNHQMDVDCAKVVIGNHVWIATRAMILKGVTIGEGAVVAGGSVVTKNVEPYKLVAGTPAKFIKYLNK